MEYTKWEGGKAKHVLDFDRCIESLRERNADQDERIKILVEENKRLKSEHYKDTELQSLQSKYDELKRMPTEVFLLPKKKVSVFTSGNISMKCRNIREQAIHIFLRQLH